MTQPATPPELLRYTLVARRPGCRQWVELGAVSSRAAMAELLRRCRRETRKSRYQVITEAA
ncbi:MAG TPA: hypothetical protein VFW88_06970 [Burkholderiales bacterium]|nr:hypothetical protein [Burkholderiales bacterium]